jgi:hypothetical protein
MVGLRRMPGALIVWWARTSEAIEEKETTREEKKIMG